MALFGIFRPGMRAYFIPLTAGLVLFASAFLPWVIVGGFERRGVPDLWALWVAGLGLLAATLAFLSLLTRRNSRHPLLVVGLAALGITFLASRIVPRSVQQQAQTWSQAVAIADGLPAREAQQPDALTGSGIYLGLAASSVLVLFGLTIVVKRAARPYVIDVADDDVD
jgi:hypothetical protein